jgi:hypothetical protein
MCFIENSDFDPKMPDSAHSSNGGFHRYLLTRTLALLHILNQLDEIGEDL